MTPVTDPLYGTVTQKSDGSFVYTPTGALKTDSFDYEVTCNGLTSMATITLPAPPVAVNDVYMRGFTSSTSISGPGVLTNDQVSWCFLSTAQHRQQTVKYAAYQNPSETCGVVIAGILQRALDDLLCSAVAWQVPCDNAAVKVTTPPSVGSVVLNADGSFTYTEAATPAPGNVTFKYEINCNGLVRSGLRCKLTANAVLMVLSWNVVADQQAVSVTC
jgi:hypothetical protein